MDVAEWVYLEPLDVLILNIQSICNKKACGVVNQPKNRRTLIFEIVKSGLLVDENLKLGEGKEFL